MRALTAAADASPCLAAVMLKLNNAIAVTRSPSLIDARKASRRTDPRSAPESPRARPSSIDMEGALFGGLGATYRFGATMHRKHERVMRHNAALTHVLQYKRRYAENPKVFRVAVGQHDRNVSRGRRHTNVGVLEHELDLGAAEPALSDPGFRVPCEVDLCRHLEPRVVVLGLSLNDSKS